MQRKHSLVAALMVVAATASAQSYQQDYVKWPASDDIATYVKAWSNRTLQMEDENFFISRVKPHKQFRNVATQVNPAFNADNDKRLVYWVPVGDTGNDNGCNALPNGRFDSEVFSMWSYVSHYGDWTSPHGWVPGGFADVAHKNGVAVSGVASIPFGGISGNWSKCLTEQAALTHDQMARFLHYHGVDGLGYNSEFSGNSDAVQKIEAQHEYIIKFMKEQGNEIAENIWYDGTNHNAGIAFDQGLGSHNAPIYGNGANRRASLFFNYNWGRNRNLERSVNYSRDMGIDPLYIYAGFNMQGNDPGSNNWEYLNQNPISVGLWGAHNNNMAWLNRAANGSAPRTVQNTYLTNIEHYFSNGNQNPAMTMPVKNGSCVNFSSNFFGMSALMSAKSALNWDLGEEAFISYFNLGNGLFFNWNGQRQHDVEWYNISAQDYLPTWRYWWAPTLLGRNLSTGDVTMNATFTWDDAYVGGSCLQITGSQKEAYLHLFKTNFGLKANDVITVRYKLLGGKVDKLTLALTMNGAETKPAGENYLVVADANTEADDELWQTATFTVSRQLNTALNNKTLALIALHFQGAENLDMLLGEVSIKRGTSTTPAKPEITLCKVLANHYKGVDAKVIFNMPNDKNPLEPVYNLDVNTSLFKVYAKTEGSEPILMGVTTSWAALVYSAPLPGTGAVQIGVSAVSVDHQSESEIAWSEPQERGTYTVNNDITINKSVIKPMEGFEIKYVDPQHTPSTWTIYNSLGQKMMTQTGTSLVVKDGEGLAQTGGYDLAIDEGTANARRFGYYVQISSDAVGAMPEIYTIGLNGEDTSADAPAVSLTLMETGTTNPVVVSYTGRKADGSASRGVRLNGRFFGTQVEGLLQASESFSIAFWVKYDAFSPEGKDWALLDITNRAGSWPRSNWGYCWHRGSSDGHISSYTFRGSASDGIAPGELKYSYGEDTKFEVNAWTHVVMTFEYSGTNTFRSKLYLNGILQASTFVRGAGGSGTGTQEDFAAKNNSIASTDWISTGGLPYNGYAIDGILDDFQIWSKAMTEADVKTSMNGLDGSNLPADVLCFWDFEDAVTSANEFLSKGTRAGKKAFAYDCIGGTEEGQGFQTPIEPIFEAGCPFISGTAYPVVTKPTWTARKALLTEAQGTGENGSAKVAFNKAGDYTLTLSLANSYGEDTRNYPVFTVSDPSSLDQIGADAADQMKVYTVSDALFVEFAEAGEYTVEVYSVQGQLVAAKTVQAEAASMLRATLHQAGVYVVKVTKDGELYRTVKVAKH